MNQVLLTNEHGDVFKRQITIDECDNEPYDDQQNFNHETGQTSPNESELFYEQYIDYPVNETAAQTTTTYEQAVGAVAPANGDGSRIRNDNRNQTLLNYNQYKLHQMRPNNSPGNGSPFTFFGMPLPSLSNLWSGGGGNGADGKPNSRADIDANGKSRLRNYRPRPGEIVDGFQFASNIRGTNRNNIPNQLPNGHPPQAYPAYPNQYKDRPYPTYYQTMYFDPKIEKGGFVPMLPDSDHKGFTPIQGPYPNDAANDTDANGNDGVDDVHDPVSTELKPNVNVELDEDEYDEGEDTKYSVRVPTVSQSSDNKSYNVSSLKKTTNEVLTTSSTGIPLIRNTPNPLHELLPRLTSTIPPPYPTQTTSNYNIPGKNDQARQNIQRISAARPITETPFAIDTVSTTSVPVRLDTIAPANRLVPSTTPLPPSTKGTSSPAGVTVRTPPGRSVITKVFTSTPSTATGLPTTTSTQSPILPTAEEYLRTTSLLNGLRNTTASSQRENEIASSTTTYSKAELEWYYRNYNRTILKEPNTDAELNRLQSNANGTQRNLFHVILFTTLCIGVAYL